MDPISDMLTIIRNAQMASRPEVSFPFSKLKYEIAKILEGKGFIKKADKKGRGVKKFIELQLKYDGKNPAIAGLKKISKPGQRIYLKAKELKYARFGLGAVIISTPKGLMTDQEARKQRIGGEIICQVW